MKTDLTKLDILKPVLLIARQTLKFKFVITCIVTRHGMENTIRVTQHLSWCFCGRKI
jgi:hypothetical protein